MIEDGERCKGCGSEDVQNSSGPDDVYGSGDYSRHDGVTLVWLLPPDRRPAPGGLCDDCVERHVEAGELEAIHSGDQGGLPGGRPSEAVYAMMFREGAVAARRAFINATEDRPAPRWPVDVDATGRILGLRRAIAPSPPRLFLGEDEREIYLDLARRMGEAHAIAACALGHADVDPGFEAASKVWAAQRVAEDAEGERHRTEGEELLAELLADLGGEDAVSQAIAALEQAERQPTKPS